MQSSLGPGAQMMFGHESSNFDALLFLFIVLITLAAWFFGTLFYGQVVGRNFIFLYF